MKTLGFPLFFTIQCVVLLVFCFALFVFVVQVTPNDRVAYLQLVHAAAPAGVPDEYQSRQYRRDICRDIYSNKLQTRLRAGQGTIVYIQDPKEPGFVEEMQHVECWMQEEIKETAQGYEQIVRHIVAERACFDYRTDTLTTEAMTFERYSFPGTKLPYEGGKPLMMGNASSAQVTFTKEGPRLEAKRLKVKLPGNFS